MAIHDLPELSGNDSNLGLIRIPDEIDVPTTPRVRRLIDSVPFRRLAHISQLGLVSLVYPAANHSRFEHSLGVYRNAVMYIDQLRHDRTFTELVGEKDVERFLVASLLHDVGHWPFCHPIEDIALGNVPRHEELARELITKGEIDELLKRDWNLDSNEVMLLLGKSQTTAADQLLANLLSGPIDIDKMDYLYRDSLHAGVPYGRHYDRGRLIGSLRVNEAGNGLAISDKGKTAAELMVFARYVMFSEVYWHHAVRGATAMLQRAFFELQGQIDLHRLFRQNEAEFKRELQQTSRDTSVSDLIDGLFGSRRQLYKRVIEFNCLEEPELFRRLSRRPYPWLVEFSKALTEQISKRSGQRIEASELLVDAPPIGLEVEFDVQVYSPKSCRFRGLRELSPVIQSLADRQFDDYVKQVRIFVHPRQTSCIGTGTTLRHDVEQAIQGAVD